MPSAELSLPELGLDPRVVVPPAGPPAPWHVRFKTGELAGPATSDAIYGWLRTGRLTSDAWVWHEGWSDWRPAGAMFLQLRKDDAPSPPYPPKAFSLHPVEDDEPAAAVICEDAEDVPAAYRPAGDLFRNGLATILLLATSAALLPVLGWVLIQPPAGQHSEAALHKPAAKSHDMQAGANAAGAKGAVRP
jgi:hypothetical protein